LKKEAKEEEETFLFS